MQSSQAFSIIKQLISVSYLQKQLVTAQNCMGSINCRITQKSILEIIAITKAESTKQTLIHTYVQLVAIAKFRGNGLLDDITTYICSLYGIL